MIGPHREFVLSGMYMISCWVFGLAFHTLRGEQHLNNIVAPCAVFFGSSSLFLQEEFQPSLAFKAAQCAFKHKNYFVESYSGVMRNCSRT